MSKLKIFILDQEWTIEKVPPHDSNLYVSNEVCTGTMWAAKQAMYISGELSSERAWRTILHELCHAYIAATQAVVPEEWSEEAVCELIAIYGYEMVEKARSIHESFYGGSNNEQGDTGI